ncbi:MAG: 2-C-methyl-D-erythritol 4-phosphate cytidylyltransferase [Oscillospiraceae bacterium]|nr:2-C-methyl-D-erythritol 4-phosphate cytidylyltransferase [Oscillospiraceae bacterium]
MNTALIFAGGTGKRMGAAGRPKQFLELHGKPIIIYTLEYFDRHPEIDAIAVVCIESWIDHLQYLLDRFRIKKVRWIVPGGATSQDSTRAGLNAIAADCDPKDTIVLIHDGVRPLITEKLISDNIAAVKKYGNAITAAPAIETIITVDGNEDVDQLIDRQTCRLARAPQSFWLADIIQMHRRSIADGYDQMLDSASLMIHYGVKLHLVESPAENIKITTPSDFYIFKAITESRENMQILGL